MKRLLITLLFICSLFSYENRVYAQNINNQTANLNTWIDSLFTEGINSYNIAGATVILMQGDSVLHINGYGLADIESDTPVDYNSSIFEVGSISKTFVATAIMQLYEDGKVDLDGDINKYLTSFQLPYKFNHPITIRHLLTHTAGFDDRNIGSAVLSEKDIIPLARYLKKRMPPQIRPSGKVISYSNHGYALLGLIVEEVSGIPFYEYIQQKILEPLKMEYSGFKKQANLKENYVTSYLQKGGQLIPYKPDFELKYPASAFSATASDMGQFISMFLNNGNYKGVQILDSITIAKMYHTPFKHYDKAEYGWLYGFSEADWNGMKLYGHGGAIKGFASQLSLLPEKKLGLFISANSSSYPNSDSRVFIDNFVYNLLMRMLPDTASKKEKPKVSSTNGTVDKPLQEFTGTYRYTQYAHNTFDKVGILIGLAPEIEIAAKEDILLVLPWNDKLVPASDLTFRSTYGNFVAFGKDTKGEIAFFFPETFSYEKLRWYEPIKFQFIWIGVIILMSLIYVITSGVRKLFARNKKGHLLKTTNFSLASLMLIFIALLAFGLISTDPMEFFYGVPIIIKIALVIPFLLIPLEAVNIYLLIKAIRLKELGTFNLIYQSIVVIAALLFIPWLMYYNLIGFNY